MWSVDDSVFLSRYKNESSLETLLFTLEEHTLRVSVFGVNLSRVPFGTCLDSAAVSSVSPQVWKNNKTAQSADLIACYSSVDLRRCFEAHSTECNVCVCLYAGTKNWKVALLVGTKCPMSLKTGLGLGSQGKQYVN